MRKRYKRPGPVILEALRVGPMAPGRLATLVYGNHSRRALGALYVAIHRLRASGAAVAFDEACERYWLTDGQPVCPQCRKGAP